MRAGRWHYYSSTFWLLFYSSYRVEAQVSEGDVCIGKVREGAAVRVERREEGWEEEGESVHVGLLLSGKRRCRQRLVMVLAVCCTA